MRIEVELFATLRDYLPAGSRDQVLLDLPDGSRVEDVARALGIPEEIGHLALVNGEEVRPDRRLQAGDVVTMFPPLAGGSEASRLTRRTGWYTRRASEASRNPVGLPDFKSGVRL